MKVNRNKFLDELKSKDLASDLNRKKSNNESEYATKEKSAIMKKLAEISEPEYAKKPAYTKPVQAKPVSIPKPAPIPKPVYAKPASLPPKPAYIQPAEVIKPVQAKPIEIEKPSSANKYASKEKSAIMKKLAEISEPEYAEKPAYSEKSDEFAKPYILIEPSYFKKPAKIPKSVIVVETYQVEQDQAVVDVQIRREPYGYLYYLDIPKINIATATLLEDIRTNLVSATTIGMKEISDPNAFQKIKAVFMREAEELLKEKLPTITPEMKRILVGKLMQDMLGLGKIEFLINDIHLEEIVIPTSKEPIKIYHKKYGWLNTNLDIEKEEDIVNYSNIIARRVGRQINVLSPLLDAHLITGDRVNSILYPISTKGNTITIRKFARDPYTIIDFINNNTLNPDIAALLWLAIEYEMNMIISGGTASGKTSLLNACMPFIPPNHRIVSVEDTRELMLPEFLYWCPLVTRSPNPEGKGAVTMLDLLVNSLRMRPDRIVLGEMRREEEARVLFEAMHTGHSVYATLHANSAAETISRLTNPPLNVPPNLLNAVNLNVVVFRDRRKGIRRVFQIAEFEAYRDSASANILYRWVPENDKIIKHSESSRFFEDITRVTGMSEKDISEDLENKKKILDLLVKNGIRDLNNFGRCMSSYYSNKEELMKAVLKNDIKKILL